MATAISASPTAPVPAPLPRSSFLVSPLYDLVFFIGSPLLALGIGLAISGRAVATAPVELFGVREPLSGFFIGSFIAAHLFIVFFRSHLNPEIFRTHPWRFTVVPAALFAALLASGWVRAAAATLAVFWDVYHSALQTFGLGRIYDRLAGNDPERGRTLDLWLNHLLYAGPILAGATFLSHVKAFYYFEQVGSTFFTSIPARARAWQAPLALGVLLLGGGFLLYYIAAHLRRLRRGERVSWPKVALYVSTATVSIWAWGFNSFGEAFFIMNFFHALQYFALVGWTERRALARILGGGADRAMALRALLLLVLVGSGYGVWAETVSMDVNRSELAFSTVILVSLLHFWYDGFVWSVRKRQV